TSLVSSLLLALIMMLYVNSAATEATKISYGRSYKIMMKTTLLYQIINAVVFMIIYWLIKSNTELPFINFSILTPENLYTEIFSAVLFYQLPPILLTALFLKSQLSSYRPFRKFPGFIRSTLFTAIVIMPVLLVASYVVMQAVEF